MLSLKLRGEDTIFHQRGLTPVRDGNYLFSLFMIRFIPILFLLILSFTAFELKAQVSVKDSAVSMVLIAPSYGLQFPAGDLETRFGVNSSVGLSVTVKRKSGWMFQADGSFIFGSKINEPGLFSNLTTDKGFIIGRDGFYGDIRVFERGYYLTLSAGKLFPVKKPNPNSGFYFTAGAGFIQHKIKIQDKKNSVPSLQDEYLKGYDRLTNGIVIRETAGYLYTGNNRLVNFFGGIELLQGFTQGRRSYQFDLMKADDAKRIDLLFSLRVGWILPLYREAPEKFYIY